MTTETKELTFVESSEPCYPKGIAYENKDYRVVFYEWLATGSYALVKQPHWRAYTLPGGKYVDEVNNIYDTKYDAFEACGKHYKQTHKLVKVHHMGKGYIDIPEYEVK
jgi:hypothetical protein